MDNIYKAVQLTIDSQNLALSKTPTHVYIANQYVDTNDTPLITAPFIIQKALENGTGVVDIVSSTIGSIYEVRLLCDAEVLISGYFYMPPMNAKFSELELYTSYPPRTPPVINEFWQQTENFILEKTNTLLNFVQVFNAVSSMRLSLGYLEELLTTKKSNLVGAINEVYKKYEGVGSLYEKNVAAAGAGASGWTALLVADESGLTQQQINNNLSGLDSIADMLGIVEPKNGQRVNVKGLAGGTFEWQADSTDAADNGIVFAVSNVTTGRWVRINFEIVYPEMFGALGDGVTDDSAALKAMFKAATIYGKLWYIPKKTYFINGNSAIEITTSGESQAKFLLPKNNTTCYFKVVRDSDNVAQTIDISTWNNLVRGSQDINATNAADKIVYISSNEVAAVRMGYNYSYTKQERLRIDARGQATTPLVYTYDNPSQIVVKAFNKSNPITIVGLNVELVSSGTGEQGAIIVERDSVTLNNPGVINNDNSKPVKRAIALVYCADTIINRPIIRNINYDGAGYGIIATGTIGIVINDPQIDNCRHAFSGAYNVDVIVNRGTTGVIDDHWGSRMVVNDTTIKCENANSVSGILYAGTDITIKGVTQVGGNSLLGVRTDPMTLRGRVIIDDVEIISNSSAVNNFYVFGLASLASIVSKGDVMAVEPELPDYIYINNININVNNGKTLCIYRTPDIHLPYKEFGELYIKDVNTNGVACIALLTVCTGYSKVGTSKVTIDNVNLNNSTSIYLAAASNDTAVTNKYSFVLNNVTNASVRVAPAMVDSIDINGGSSYNIAIDRGAWTVASPLVLNNVKMLGGIVNAGIVGAAFYNCNFAGEYNTFPTSTNVTMIGCTKTVPQPNLPTNITRNISAPYIT